MRFFLDALTGFLAVLILALPREYLKGWFASLLGDDTPKRAGRLSWNPFVHLDPVGTIAFILFDFGWTRPVPIKYWKMRLRKVGLFLVSIAGPVINVVEALVFGRLARDMRDNAFVYYTLYKSAKYSLTYAFFSLLPIPPLDGSRILGSLLPDEYTEWYIKYEVYGILFMLALLVLWILPLIMNPFVNMLNDILGVFMGENP